MENEKLDKKLAKWAGFKYEDVDPQDGGDIIEVCIYPDGTRILGESLTSPNPLMPASSCFCTKSYRQNYGRARMQ